MIFVSQNNKKLKIQKIPSIGLLIANDNKKKSFSSLFYA